MSPPLDSAPSTSPAPMIYLLLLLPICLVACAAPPWGSGYPKQGWIAHNAYFQLTDPSEASVEALIDGCWQYLAPIEGVLFFAVGRRAQDHEREVNAGDYDVSLHVHFPDQQAHDIYQIHSSHLTFVDKFRGAWKSVRVCDSIADAPPIQER